MVLPHGTRTWRYAIRWLTSYMSCMGMKSRGSGAALSNPYDSQARVFNYEGEGAREGLRTLGQMQTAGVV